MQSAMDVMAKGLSDVGLQRAPKRKAERTERHDCITVASSSDEDSESEVSEDYGEWPAWLPGEYRIAPGRLSKRYKSSNDWLREACSMGENQPRCRVEDLYGFMNRRETARVRKEVKCLPPEQWYAEGDHMRFIFLTNVRREDDPTTRAVRAALQPVLETWTEGLETEAGEWTGDQRRVAGLLVFHCALWRAFGTKEFISALGFLENLISWDSDSWQPVVATAMRCWEKRTICFTEAYCPPRAWRQLEAKFQRQPMGKAHAQKLFERVCENLQGIWEHRFQVAREAEQSRSWRHVIQTIMAVPNYGGTGFLAKELTQDLLATPLFCNWDEVTGRWDSKCKDLNDWCPVGPGARRSLNRLHGRPTKFNAYSSSRMAREHFEAELLAIYEQRHQYWNPRRLIDGVCPAGELALHDVQFQLCEFDKYERARLDEGYVRRYRSDSQSSPELRPIEP
ncbi:unnamed protein product [Effrenium voratum]|nr:unnamed protein product [Effrenium voratum]